MIVACWCGETTHIDGDLLRCPNCGTIHALPKVTDRDVEEMEADLAGILKDAA